MTLLLDGNVLKALVIDTHIHHERAHRWFGSRKKTDLFATCAITQGTLLRLHMQTAKDRSAAAAWAALALIEAHPRHVWWEVAFPYSKVPHSGLQGAAQVTDAWLVEAAGVKNAKLATMDTPLAARHHGVVELIPG